MKKLLTKDLAKKSLKELVALRNKIRREVFDHKLKNTMRALGQTHLISLGKRNIARINTSMTAKISETPKVEAK